MKFGPTKGRNDVNKEAMDKLGFDFDEQLSWQRFTPKPVRERIEALVMNGTRTRLTMTVHEVAMTMRLKLSARMKVAALITNPEVIVPTDGRRRGDYNVKYGRVSKFLTLKAAAAFVYMKPDALIDALKPDGYAKKGGVASFVVVVNGRDTEVKVKGPWR